MKIVSNKLKDKSGAALIFVMVAILIIFIMISIAASISQTNTKQAGAQEKGIQAYYMARSGVELAYEALQTTDLLDKLGNGTFPTPNPEHVVFEEGSADVTVSISGSGYDRKVLISSVGKLNGSDITRTCKLEFYYKFGQNGEKKEMIWSE